MLLSKYILFNSKDLKISNKPESKGLLSNLTGIRTPLSQIPLLDSLLFKKVSNEWNNKQIFISSRETYAKIHLKQPEFTYSA